MKTIKILFFVCVLSLFSSQSYAWELILKNISNCSDAYSPVINASTTSGRSFTVQFEVSSHPIFECPGLNSSNLGFKVFFKIKHPVTNQDFLIGTSAITYCNVLTNVVLTIPANIPNIYSKDMILYAETQKINLNTGLPALPFDFQNSEGYFAFYDPNATTPENYKMLTNGTVTLQQSGYGQWFFGTSCYVGNIAGVAGANRYKVEWTLTGNFANVIPQEWDSRSRGFSFDPEIVCAYYQVYSAKIDNQTIKLWTYVYDVAYNNQQATVPCETNKAVIVYRLVEAPTINYMTSNIPDNKIFLGETAAYYCNATGYDISSYTFLPKYCSGFGCYTAPSGIQFSQTGSTFVVKNLNYNTVVTCQQFQSQCSSEELAGPDAVFFKLHATATNAWGTSSTFVYPSSPNIIVPMKGLRPPSAGGGCPHIVTFKDGVTEYENNILHRNEALSFGADLDDYTILKNDISETDSTLSFYIKETDNKYNYFDQMKMYAYDVPPGCKLVVSENNQFYLFDTTMMVSPSNATLNQSTDITSVVQYNTVSENVLEGAEQDIIDAEFSSSDIKSLTTTFYNTYQDSINGGIIDSMALVILMSRNPNANSNVKSDAASVSIITENDARHYTIFRRENLEYVVLPISTRDDIIESISMSMNRDYSIKFIGVTGILNISEGITELPLVDALHSSPDIMVPPSSQISGQDDVYLTLDSSQYLKLTYSALPSAVSVDYTRKHIFFVNGHYTGTEERPVQTDNKDKREPNYELLGNKPNPFNPTTTIAFKLAKDSFVKIKVYNLLGQLISTLSDGMQKAGYNEVRFDGTNLSSGIYFYDFQVEGAREIRRMVLIK